MPLAWPRRRIGLRCEGAVGGQPGQRPAWWPVTRHDSPLAQHMRAGGGTGPRFPARTRHAAVLVKDGSYLAWGTNGVPFPGEDHCYWMLGEFGDHDQCQTHAVRGFETTFDGSNMSEASEIAGGQVGSQRWQIPGDTRPRLATVGAAQRYIGPHLATAGACLLSTRSRVQIS